VQRLKYPLGIPTLILTSCLPPTKTTDKDKAEAILAAWTLQAHLELQPGLCRAGVRQVSCCCQCNTWFDQLIDLG